MTPKSRIVLSPKKTSGITPGLKIEPRRYARKLAIAITLVAIFIGIVYLLSIPFGQVVILGYGLVALVRKIPSRRTFALALTAFLAVPVSLLFFGGNNIISSAFATYAFLLLVIGVVTVAIELRRE